MDERLNLKNNFKMSEQDQDKIVGRITRKLLWIMVPFLLTGIGLQVRDHFVKADSAYVDMHYRELYRLTAELSTTLSMYMQANDKDKVRIQQRMDYIIERMDKFTDKDVKRDITQLDTSKRKYGLEFTPLL